MHCHTNLSDGYLSPEQIKEHYKSKGYSVVAYTDHDILIPHDELNDENFLALHGFEMEINEPKDASFNFLKTSPVDSICINYEHRASQRIFPRMNFKRSYYEFE